MPTITVTRYVRAPREKVARYFADPRSYFQVHADHYKRFTITSQEGNVAYVDETWEIGGRAASFTHRIVLNLPHSIDLEIVKGDGKGSRETISFEDENDHTKVTYRSDFKLGGILGPILSLLVREQMAKLLEQMADEDQHFLEEN